MSPHIIRGICYIAIPLIFLIIIFTLLSRTEAEYIEANTPEFAKNMESSDRATTGQDYNVDGSVTTDRQKRDAKIQNCKSDKGIHAVEYAWDTWHDMDFIGTIASESMMDENAKGDKGMSYGYCQIHKGYNAKLQKQYRAIVGYRERLNFCHALYTDWVNRGVIHKRLYGYNSRAKGLTKLNISCK